MYLCNLLLRMMRRHPFAVFFRTPFIVNKFEQLLIPNLTNMNKMLKAVAAVMLMMAVVFTAGCNKPEDEPNNDENVTVTVTTITPSNITTKTAVCGAEVVVSEGVTLEELGVCWGFQENPTASEEHLSTAQWNEPFTCKLTELNHNTVYHVRAYAKKGSDYYYGADKKFTTEERPSGNGTYNGHDYIDLGLPSGTLWATCNVGAEMPEDLGGYFAWGETTTKATYEWSTYKYCNGSENTITKYCNDANYGYNGYSDELVILQPDDDAATANWGNGWRMPTLEECKELVDNTTSTWIRQNAVSGRIFTSENGNSIFLPAAHTFLYGQYWGGDYWSSSLCGRPDCGEHLGFGSGAVDAGGNAGNRYAGLSVRPVRSVE